MEERILDYLPNSKSETKNFTTIYKWIHRIFVFNFWHFNIAFGSYLIRIYNHVGHLPYYASPRSSSLSSISRSWRVHDNWIEFNLAIVFFTMILYCIIVYIFIFSVFDSKGLNLKFYSQIDRLIVGFIGFIISFGLLFYFDFSISHWYIN